MKDNNENKPIDASKQPVLQNIPKTQAQEFMEYFSRLDPDTRERYIKAILKLYYILRDEK
ncbi:MAG: hypothetical protein JXA07_01935 [Spirochaetes bacterium]|nr:hypothetical protein [Spirochaetota bacterium]